MSETIQTLLDAAEASIRSRGFHAVSFRELADELGIKSSSVHYYFPQKQDLGIALVDRYQMQFFDTLDELTASVNDSNGKIDAFCQVYKMALTGNDKICLCGMLGAEIGGLPQALAKSVAGFFNSNIEWLINALPEAMPRLERLERAQTIVSSLQGAMMVSRSLNDNSILDKVIAELRLN